MVAVGRGVKVVVHNVARDSPADLLLFDTTVYVLFGPLSFQIFQISLSEINN